MFGKTEELFNSIDLDKYLLDGTIQPAKLRRPPDYSPPGPAQSTSDHTSDQLPIQQVRPDTETNVRRITVAKVFVTRSDINDFWMVKWRIQQWNCTVLILCLVVGIGRDEHCCQTQLRYHVCSWTLMYVLIKLAIGNYCNCTFWKFCRDTLYSNECCNGVEMPAYMSKPRCERYLMRWWECTRL